MYSLQNYICGQKRSVYHWLPRSAIKTVFMARALCVGCSSKLFMSIIPFSHLNSRRVGTIIIPVSQIRKLRHREVLSH